MSEQVISVSSDEEDCTEPPPKRYKPPVLPEVTLTLVTSPILPEKVSIETVLLDSDDETIEKISEKIDVTKKTNSLEILKKPAEITSSTTKVDLIDLIDDEDIQSEPISKTNDTEKTSCNVKVNVITSANDETVSVDDSDSEIVASEELGHLTDKNKEDLEKNSEKNELVEENNQSIIIDDSDDETEKENHCENESSDAFPVQCKKTSANDILAASSSKDQFTETNQICDLPNVKCKELFVDVYRISANESKNESSNRISVSNSIKTNKLFKNQKESWSAARAGSVSKDELEEAKTLFKKFIKMVEEKIVDSAFEEILPKKVPIIRKYFNRSGTYINDKMFKTLLTESISGIKKSTTASGANTAVLAFHKVFEHLKSHVTESTIVVEEDHLPKIKKLERTIKLLRKRIHQLEVAEVNFDDDEDSAYIMLDRYQSRLNKVYAKYCQYIKRNPYHGRATHDRITFVNSSYNVLNQAITKKFKNSLIFPSYYELEKYITKVVKRENLNLSESEIKIESKKCFKVLGNIFQKKRRQELYDSHLDFVEFSEDPATKDISLENVLKKNFSEGKEKIEKLYQKYVNKQEKGEDTVSTEDEQSTDDSDAEDDKDKKGKAKKGGKVKEKKGNTKNNKQQLKNDIKDDDVPSEDNAEKVNGERRMSLKDEQSTDDCDAKDDKDKKGKAKKSDKVKGKKGNLKNNKQVKNDIKDDNVPSEDNAEEVKGERRISLKDEDNNEIIEEKQDEDQIMEENGEDEDTESKKENTSQNSYKENQANDSVEIQLDSREDIAL